MNPLAIANDIRSKADELITLLQNTQTTTITPLSQRDRRWAYTRFPGTATTLARAGCYVTSLTMLINLAGYPDTPDQVLHNLSDVGCFSGANLVRPLYVAKAYPRVRFVERQDWLNTSADMEYIKAHLPLIVQVEFHPGGARPPTDQHFVLALAYQDGDLRIADPWSGGVVSLLTNYALFDWSLERAIYGARLFEIAERE